LYRAAELLRSHLDRATLFALMQRLWLIGSGPLTALLITLYFTPEVQGYYYTFASIIAFQIFAELGLGQVILLFASHEWAELGLDADGRIVGNPDALSRLASLHRFAVAWYLGAAIVLIAGQYIGGIWLFSASHSTVEWRAPWIALCLVSSGIFMVIPIWSLIEGCNQVAEVYRFRFGEAIVFTVFLWIAIVARMSLWVPVVGSAAKLVYNLWYLAAHKRNFIASLRAATIKARIKWGEIWQLQKRFALSWISGYFIFSLFTPVAFRYQGPVIAGQVGITLAMTRLLYSLSGAWLATRLPSFGVAIARRDYARLDKMALRAGLLTIGTAVVGAVSLWSGLYLMSIFYARFAVRFLPLFPTGLFLAASVMIIATLPISSYLRAHKQEPMMGISVLGAVLIGLSTWFFGKTVGVNGMGMGYLVINSLVMLPGSILICQRCRAEWHTPAQSAVLSATA